jgi:hypothetical protein
MATARNFRAVSDSDFIDELMEDSGSEAEPDSDGDEGNYALSKFYCKFVVNRVTSLYSLHV